MPTRRHSPALGFFSLSLSCLFQVLTCADAAYAGMESAAPPSKLSYYRDIRPILQANCQGCHQPAKAKGGYIMTHFKGLLAGGETEGTAIVAEHPDQSALL